MSKILIVIPCYNEASRWDPAAFRQLVSYPSVGLLLVDDQSHDGTIERMTELAAETPDRIKLLPLPSHQGKAEAVRQGLIAGMKTDASIVGFTDADFATPPEELHRLVEQLQKAPNHVIGILGSRVLRLGGWIRRRTIRHYLGRFFATWASSLLKLPVYDTQCGAKMFRTTPSLHHALQEPFIGSWTFDVELIHRLCPPESIDISRELSPLIELPLNRWQDKPGSKLSVANVPSLSIDITRLWWRLRRSRQQQ